MNSYTARLAALDHMREILVLSDAHRIAKAREHNIECDHEAARRMSHTIDREMADLAIILDNYVVGPAIREEREKLFQQHGNEIAVEVRTTPV